MASKGIGQDEDTHRLPVPITKVFLKNEGYMTKKHYNSEKYILYSRREGVSQSKKNSECWYTFHILPPPWLSQSHLFIIILWNITAQENLSLEPHPNVSGMNLVVPNLQKLHWSTEPNFPNVCHQKFNLKQSAW